MKQVLQTYTGETLIEELPCPKVKKGHLLIKTHVSLISSGTERMMVDFAKANWFEKVKRQPEKIVKVFNKLKSEGFSSTMDAIKSTIDLPLPLGYCNVGEVIGVGDGVDGFAIGDRVVSNGNHAEVVNIPKNLCAKIPHEVSDEDAVFTVLGAIALQGIRLTKPTLGESFVVIGLGLIGQLTVQLLKAHGCKVLGVDFDKEKCEHIEKLGAESFHLTEDSSPLSKAQDFSKGQGVDGVIITAATNSHEPMHQAAEMCRKRGRIVLVGVTGLNLLRSDFYEKELSFQVSCSYGPGRYDPNYEQKGHDYPLGFVRWTEQRNFEAILDMMKESKIKTQNFISHKYPIDTASDAYTLLSSGEPSMGIVIQYPRKSDSPDVLNPTVYLKSVNTVERPHNAQVSFIGAGGYATKVLMPAFENQVHFQFLCHTGSAQGVHFAKKMNFKGITTDENMVYQDPNTNTIVIATPHNLHAHQVVEGLKKHKHIFCEKPLAINLKELSKIEKQYEKNIQKGHHTKLMVGFNRRFSPLTIKAKKQLDTIQSPKTLIYTVNAGIIPKDHWIQDPFVGGGRIIGEGCHFIDLLRHLVGHPIDSFTVDKLSFPQSNETESDKITATFKFKDGSLGTLHYFANGAQSFPKERLEVFCNGHTLVLSNFENLTAFDWPGFKNINLQKQDKGQLQMAQKFAESITKNYPSPIPFEEIIEVSRLSIEVAQKLK